MEMLSSIGSGSVSTTEQTRDVAAAKSAASGQTWAPAAGIPVHTRRTNPVREDAANAAAMPTHVLSWLQGRRARPNLRPARFETASPMDKFAHTAATMYSSSGKRKTSRRIETA
jgi:hypothetical protein